MLKRFILGMLTFILAGVTFAINPIKWSLDAPFPNPVLVPGSSYTATYTFTNQLSFKLIKPIYIEKSASPLVDYTFTDQCSGLKLTPQQHCTVSIHLDPFTTGVKTVGLTIAGYDNNRVPLPVLTSIATSATGVTITESTTMPLPASMHINTTAPYAFSFTNTGSATATGVVVTSNTLGFSTTCTTTLPAGQSCTVTGNFTPTVSTPTTQTVTATLSFVQGSAVVASTSTSVNSAIGLTGVVTQALPSITQIGSFYDLTFTFTNNDAVGLVITNNAFAPTINPPITVSSNSCTVSPLPAYSSCQMTATFNSGAAGPFSISGTVNALTLTTSTTAQAASSGDRSIIFYNECAFPVWFSLNGGAITGSPPCTTTADCPVGSSCNPTANGGAVHPGLCFWDNAGPLDNVYLLAPTTSNQVPILVPPVLPSDHSIWSGNISASTGCSGTSCLQADCGNAGGATSCAVGAGFSQPATQAEITMLNTGVDSYDVEVINGFHIPIEMAPNVGVGVPDGYSCGSPGALAAGNQFGACNWTNAIIPSVASANVPYPSTSYYWVTATGPSHVCTPGVQSCPTAGQLCGLDIGMNPRCGDFLGFWTANEACAISATNAQPYFGCTNYLNAPFPASSYQMSQLYGCQISGSVLNSCYLAGAQTDCCGCVNWQNIVGAGITLPATTDLCINTDPIWTTANVSGGVQSTLQWMKSACPNYYTYPFDDRSSSFTCSSPSQPAINGVGYTITFCPGGNSGLPAGKTDGR